MKNAIHISVVPTLALLLIGCTSSMSYNQIDLGSGPGDYARVLPEETTRKTAVGQCHWSAGWNDREAAVVMLLTDTRLVAGKAFVEQRGQWESPSLVAEVQLDRQLYGVEEAGPLDTLRLVALELAQPTDDPDVRRSHNFLIAAIVRMFESWPDGAIEVDLPGIDTEALAPRVPAGGRVELNAEPRVLTYRYVVERALGS